MAGQLAVLSFCWWNLHDFAHFDAGRASERRWPKRAEDFEAKRDRILATLQELFEGGFPDLLAVCKIADFRGGVTCLFPTQFSTADNLVFPGFFGL
jgi:hypothetical protein